MGLSKSSSIQACFQIRAHCLPLSPRWVNRLHPSRMWCSLITTRIIPSMLRCLHTPVFMTTGLSTRATPGKIVPLSEGYELSPSIRLLATPGHTPQDITTLVGTKNGIVAFTHLWWFVEGPADDPLAADMTALHANRERVLRVAALIVPGHGAPFTPGETTPLLALRTSARSIPSHLIWRFH